MGGVGGQGALDYVAALQINDQAQHVAIDVDLGDTVDKLKMKVWDKEGVPISKQRLVFNGTVLENDCTHSSYGNQREYTINLSLNVRGGIGGGKMILILSFTFTYIYSFTTLYCHHIVSAVSSSSPSESLTDSGSDDESSDDSVSIQPRLKRVKVTDSDVTPEVGMCVSIDYEVGDGKSEPSIGVICEVVRDENTTDCYDLSVAFVADKYIERDVRYPDDMNNDTRLRFIYSDDGIKIQSIPEDWQSWSDIEKALADRVADNRADIDSSNGKQRRRIIWLIVVFVGYKKMEVVRLPPFSPCQPLSS